MGSDVATNSSDFDFDRRRMVDEQLRARGIADEAVLAAMGAIPRERFVPEDMAAMAYDDRALPIEAGQTISQPFIVAYMTEALRLRPSSRVLEIGTGTGYQAAVLARLSARVYTIERIAELQEAARKVLGSIGAVNVEYRVGDGSLGWPEEAPFDRIILTAGAPHVPPTLVDQLGPGGVLVGPIGPAEEQTIFRVSKDGRRPTLEPLMTCRFVKLIGREGW